MNIAELFYVKQQSIKIVLFNNHWYTDPFISHPIQRRKLKETEINK